MPKNSSRDVSGLRKSIGVCALHRQCDRWVVKFPHEGKIKERGFSLRNKHKAEAFIWQINNGKRDVLSPVELSEYMTAKEILQGASLIEAADFFMRQTKIKKISVVDAVEKFLDEKKNLGLSPRTLDDFKFRLAKLPDGNLAEIDGEKLKESNAGESSIRSRRNNISAWNAFLKWAHDERFIRSVPKVLKPKQENISVEFYTPEEFWTVIDAATGSEKITLALAGLAGLRTNEIVCLQERDIDLEARIIYQRRKSQRATPRTVPIVDSLFKILEGTKQTKGFQANTINRAWSRVFKSSGIPIKENGLRKSFITYRMALLGDITKVATESGSSPAMIKNYYLGLVPKSSAEEYFR